MQREDSLDLSNAFNSAWRPYIAEKLKESGASVRLGGMCKSFLEEREIQSGDVCVRMDKGCPQGFSLGPSLWNVVMQGWFQTMEGANRIWAEGQVERRGGQGMEKLAQAYADDQVVMMAGKSREIEKKWHHVWQAFKVWERESGAKYNLDRTEAVLLEKDGKRIRPPVIRVDGQTVNIKTSIKYLGVMVDRQLNEHVTNARKKSARLANKIVNLTRKEYGENTRFIKVITDRVVAPAVL